MTVYTFQGGADSYTSCRCQWYVVGGAVTSNDVLRTDSNGSITGYESLIEFTNLFSDDSGPVSTSATISEAILRLIPDGDGGSDAGLFRMTSNWTTGTTNTVTTGTDTEATRDLTITGNGLDQYLDVTTTVTAWQGGTANYGWLLKADNTSGITYPGVSASSVLIRAALIITTTESAGGGLLHVGMNGGING